MSLFIRGGKLNDLWTEWHTGEPVPKGIGRVVHMQADGDELEILIKAMENTQNFRIAEIVNPIALEDEGVVGA